MQGFQLIKDSIDSFVTEACNCTAAIIISCNIGLWRILHSYWSWAFWTIIQKQKFSYIWVFQNFFKFWKNFKSFLKKLKKTYFRLFFARIWTKTDFPQKMSSVSVWGVKISNHMQKIKKTLHPFLPNVPLLCPLKTPKNLWFSDVFRRYKKGTLGKMS